MLLAKSRPIVVIFIADGSHFARERLTAFTPWHLDAVSGSHPPHLLSSSVIGVAAANGKTNRKRRSTSARRACPAVAGDPHVVARRRHHSGHRPPLRPRRIPSAAGSSVLVPVFRGRHGHGLALVRHTHH